MQRFNFFVAFRKPHLQRFDFVKFCGKHIVLLTCLYCFLALLPLEKVFEFAGSREFFSLFTFFSFIMEIRKLSI